jgi:hypothetical protein
MNHEQRARLRTLSAFLRSQANLTDGHPPKPGPGDVRLNHEEAMTIADTLDALLADVADEEPRP